MTNATTNKVLMMVLVSHVHIGAQIVLKLESLKVYLKSNAQPVNQVLIEKSSHTVHVLMDSMMMVS